MTAPVRVPAVPTASTAGLRPRLCLVHNLLAARPPPPPGTARSCGATPRWRMSTTLAASLAREVSACWVRASASVRQLCAGCPCWGACRLPAVECTTTMQ